MIFALHIQKKVKVQETAALQAKNYPPAATLNKESKCYVTRGNDSRRWKSHVKYDLRKFNSSNKVVNTWNSLPSWVVSAKTTDV